ncbi:MAG: hypothetical protein MZV70_00335 [Desulfobacterales bacterium]|nr:hypothetical protein [Desulfobacterales bacterium]
MGTAGVHDGAGARLVPAYAPRTLGGLLGGGRRGDGRAVVVAAARRARSPAGRGVPGRGGAPEVEVVVAEEVLESCVPVTHGLTSALRN